MRGKTRVLLRNGIAFALALLGLCAPALPEETVYVRNEWNFVEGSMDVSAGIPEDAPGRLGEIRRAGVLRVVTEPYFAPQEFIDPKLSGQARYVGSDMELARLIAERMGVELEIVPKAFSEVLTTIQAGGCDLAVSALSYTGGRAAVMEMSKGYYYSREEVATGLMIREADRDRFRTLEDLHGADLVAQSGSVQENLAAENVTEYREFRRMNSLENMYLLVRSGQVDAAVVDIETARLYIGSHPGCGLAIAENIRFPMKPQYLGDRIAAPKGELALMYFVNGVIDEVLASGLYEQWYNEYSEYALRVGS